MSPWAPDAEVRALLVGAVIKRSGQHVTDIDAVGVRGNSLLLISCKSSAYSGQYDTGDPRAIKGLENRAAEALTSWLQKVQYVRDNPQCLAGFDFGRYRIIPLVCYPFAPYLTIGPLTEEVVPGLRAVSSVSELRSWLFRANRAG